MKKILGYTSGLAPSEWRSLEHIYHRRVPPDLVISHELAREIAKLSWEINSSIGVIIDRRGRIEGVIRGKGDDIECPVLGQRLGESRFRGVRLIYTKLKQPALNRKDFNYLIRARLDIIGQLEVTSVGESGVLLQAHLLPENKEGERWRQLPPSYPWELKADFQEFIHELEREFSQKISLPSTEWAAEKAILAGVYPKNTNYSEFSMKELEELAKASGADIKDKIIQRREHPDPRYLVGEGKLDEILESVFYYDAQVVIFDQDLTPLQVSTLEDRLDVKVIDRTQLILDIFALRAKSNDGKIQVELARLKYLMPRLIHSGNALSRLGGGIGGNRGLGEKKIELDRRRVKDRIAFLEKKIKELSKRRHLQRKHRFKSSIPTVSLLGYTNAGKSTIFNFLSNSDVVVKNEPFTTLDPTARTVSLSGKNPFVLTDTVGFIRNLPKDLVAAFKATLEELSEAALLIQVADASDPELFGHIQNVNAILESLNLNIIPKLMIFNKRDLISQEEILPLVNSYEALLITAFDRDDQKKLLEAVQERLHSNIQNKSCDIEFSPI